MPITINTHRPTPPRTNAAATTQPPSTTATPSALPVPSNKPLSEPEAPRAQQPALPSIHLRALFTWLAVYSTLMATQLTLGPALLPLPLPIRTLLVTAIVVPTVVYVLLPAILRAHAALSHRTPPTH
ncbi:hypothetical protein [Actinomadura rupiterrae]|uniref:hypothetical protein n=1 Tax=Actinomadura rupiterrae TaxID=559627 RepID=UPI0020A4AB97|nr:hypothetical protein [Actinomadura rupiterrae]MCP2340693.1 hypothetical protein [Actinomadura rupiterrae]